ncbi:MAG: hypothetical protein JNK15_15310 [Planctomycetes bacterium]|nr:hypothetical protein [Planctomycetota bacterium]
MAVLGGALLAGCTVADNLSAPVMLAEVDRIVRVEGTGPGRTLHYEPRAVVSRWYIRAFATQPIRPVLGLLFGRTSEQELANPRAHVRELLRELPDETHADTLLCAQAAVRLGWIAELESNTESRLCAIDGLCRMAEQLEVPLFTDLARFGEPIDGDRWNQARAGLAAGAPDVRTAEFGEAGRAAYAEALRLAASAPLGDGASRLLLLEELTRLLALEPNAELREVASGAMRSALRHTLEGALVRLVQGRAAEDVDLRLCAMEQIRRHGGPATVPLLLAVMAATPAQVARGEPLYDTDPLVQLRLIQYCGQLRGELAMATTRLPGRSGEVLLSPAQFLATLILNQQAYYSKLRTPALVALTWSLQRPGLDPDPAWVAKWLDGNR